MVSRKVIRLYFRHTIEMGFLLARPQHAQGQGTPLFWNHNSLDYTYVYIIITWIINPVGIQQTSFVDCANLGLRLKMKCLFPSTMLIESLFLVTRIFGGDQLVPIFSIDILWIDIWVFWFDGCDGFIFEEIQSIV